MKDELAELPTGWAWTTVGEIYNIVGGGTPSTGIAEYWEGDIPWITSADIYGLKDIKPRKQITQKAIENSATSLVPKGSLIVVTRVGLGKIAITNTPLAFSQDSQALIGNNSLVFPDYSLYYLSKAVQIFKYRHRGTTIAGVTKKQLSELPYALPPLHEQRRIVAKIEVLFTELDAAVSALKNVKAQLKRYRQAVLKYAFEGKLTEEWRKVNKDKIEPASVLLERIKEERRKRLGKKYKELPTLDTSGLSELPRGWVWMQLALLFEWSNGVGLTKKKMYAGDYLVYGGNGITGTHNEWLSEEESIVIGRVGAHCGNVNLTKPKSWITDNAIYSSWHTQYIHLNFFHYLLQNFKLNELAGGSGQPYISQTILNGLVVPLLPLVEQRRIVEEIERLLSVADMIEKTAEKSFNQAERLRQSILKKAFEGKLVPQDPRDEPAEKLLEQIKMEKSNQEKTTIARTRRPSANKYQKHLIAR